MIDENLIDPLYEDAKKFVIETGITRFSAIQRKLLIGYNRCSRIIQDLEDNKVISKDIKDV